MTPVTDSTSCIACAAGSTYEVMESETFPFGDERIEIEVTVPVIRCHNCNFAYTDGRAEKARHAAVCEHMGLLAPEEILHLRKTVLCLSRDAFHASYGISAASMERWENGKLFQSESADTLLRALMDPAAAQRLDRRKPRVASSTDASADNVIWVRFPNLGSRAEIREDAIARGREFSLCIQAR